MDLREIGDIYEWVVLRARLFNVEVDLSPLGDASPHFEIPLARFTEEYLVASPEFIVNEEAPAPHVLGRYGYGYAIRLHDPAYSRGPLLWGPGRFDPGFESFVFEVRDTGETVVTSPFAVNRPDRIFGLSPDPVAMGLQVADFFFIRTGFAPPAGPQEWLRPAAYARGRVKREHRRLSRPLPGTLRRQCGAVLSRSALHVRLLAANRRRADLLPDSQLERARSHATGMGSRRSCRRFRSMTPR